MEPPGGQLQGKADFPAALNQESEGNCLCPQASTSCCLGFWEEKPFRFDCLHSKWPGVVKTTRGPELLSPRLHLGQRDWGWAWVDRSRHLHPGPGSTFLSSSSWILPESHQQGSNEICWFQSLGMSNLGLVWVIGRLFKMKGQPRGRRKAFKGEETDEGLKSTFGKGWKGPRINNSRMEAWKQIFLFSKSLTSHPRSPACVPTQLEARNGIKIGVKMLCFCYWAHSLRRRL